MDRVGPARLPQVVSIKRVPCIAGTDGGISGQKRRDTLGRREEFMKLIADGAGELAPVLQAALSVFRHVSVGVPWKLSLARGGSRSIWQLDKCLIGNAAQILSRSSTAVIRHGEREAKAGAGDLVGLRYIPVRNYYGVHLEWRNCAFIRVGFLSLGHQPQHADLTQPMTISGRCE